MQRTTFKDNKTFKDNHFTLPLCHREETSAYNLEPNQKRVLYI